ncbi:MAG: hypothetical protein LC774_15495 [Acidobacteria bacterium]|nr:hypothetical protein [Acidobacteriota bacterium]
MTPLPSASSATISSFFKPVCGSVRAVRQTPVSPLNSKSTGMLSGA